jgi:ion channel-forming bestrophin family protein
MKHSINGQSIKAMTKATKYKLRCQAMAIAFVLSCGTPSVASFSSSQVRYATTKRPLSSGQKRDRMTFLHSGARYSTGCTVNSDDPVNNRHSASDWFYNIRSFPQSKVLREIRNPVLAVATWSLIVSLVHRIGLASFSGPSLRYFAEHMCIPGTAHSFLVSALGLLLVFRTNSAYQRFNVSIIVAESRGIFSKALYLTHHGLSIEQEGRKIWENILSVSRNMSRMLQLYSPEIGESRKKRILRLVAAYPYLLRHHIRPGCLCAPPEQSIPKKYRLLLHENMARRNLPETRHEVELSKSTNDMLLRVSNNVLGDEHDDVVCAKQCWVDKRHLPWCLFRPTSLPQIAKADNRPLWVCDRMAAVMMEIPYGPNFSSRERLTLLKMVDSLTNAIGQCERIHQTAVPLNYARHSLRSLTLWLFTLPFALVKDMGLFTAPVNACIAWLLFGVYQIGYSIEDPFQGSLRLSILCDAIRRNVIGQSEELRDSAFRLVDENGVYQSEFDLSSTSSPILPSEFLPTHMLVDQKLLNAPNFLDNTTGVKRSTEVGI